ncbi:hypothetical protein K438DRAFT_1964734 [Mycena galopus ATCC 62051]|nr:hypothetical protein K438DRAFT_1964734 [Mycena galopus ATCC 62051]
MSTTPECDRSWDVAQIHPTSIGYITTRPRPEARPEARKTVLAHYMNDAARLRETMTQICKDQVDQAIAQVRREHKESSIRTERKFLSIRNQLISQAESTVRFNDITELYECYNDIIFDVDRQPTFWEDDVLSLADKEILKSSGLGYLSRLLNPPQTLPSDVEALRLRALAILGPEQEHLCRVLLDIQDSDGQRHILYHIRPDRATALDRVGVFLDDEEKKILKDFLNTNPSRLPSRRDQPDADLALFSKAGTYVNVNAQNEYLQTLRAERSETAAFLEALERKG